MSDTLLMKKGLEGLFSPKKEFENESQYGKKILYVAWAVEILAALIGLTIAWATAYDAYRGVESPTEHHLLNALIGALPFIVIAIIEPTKIPLAGGFYKTRMLGWKLLILIALLGLTAVTFETMFNGLERNLTNVTRGVVDSENSIRFLNDQLNEKKRKLKELQSKSATEMTSDLQQALDKLQADFQRDINSLTESAERQTAGLLENKRSLQNQHAVLAGQSGNSTKSQVDILNVNMSSLESQIKGLEADRERELANYRSSVNQRDQSATSAINQRVNLLKSQLEQKKNEIEKLRTQKIDQERELQRKLRDLSEDYDQKLKKLNEEHEAARNEAGFLFTGGVDERFKPRREALESSVASEKAILQKRLEQIIAADPAQITRLQEEASQLQNEITNAITDNRPAGSGVDQNKINSITESYNSKIGQIRKSISRIQAEISKIVEAQSGVAERERSSLQAQIAGLDSQIGEITAATNERLETRKKNYAEAKANLENAKNQRILEVKAEKDAIPLLEHEIAKINDRIDEQKRIKRSASYDSQVYRLAALAYGKADVADVTREEIKVISVIWFGSIALIVSTVGTILALISYILRDPEAFVERRRFSISRRINRLSYLLFKRASKLLFSAIDVLIALTKMILAFAEIFRGLVGVPTQRAIRRALIAYRRRLNKPRVIEVEKEVEKIVEKVVEVEVEVEKTVEKIVEIEVPVEKVAIKEVPVEIVRKELVYVPLYSAEAGLIDGSPIFTSPKAIWGTFDGGKREQTKAPEIDKSGLRDTDLGAKTQDASKNDDSN